jgi:hypothetical protein
MTLQQLINKALNDPAFFSALKKDPASFARDRRETHAGADQGPERAEL